MDSLGGRPPAPGREVCRPPRPGGGVLATRARATAALRSPGSRSNSSGCMAGRGSGRRCGPSAQRGRGSPVGNEAGRRGRPGGRLAQRGRGCCDGSCPRSYPSSCHPRSLSRHGRSPAWSRPPRSSARLPRSYPSSRRRREGFSSAESSCVGPMRHTSLAAALRLLAVAILQTVPDRSLDTRARNGQLVSPRAPSVPPCGQYPQGRSGG
jgi:hypothetical protein